MDNVWFTPQGYQRTSKKIQKRCLAQLLSFGEPRGRILDVGCGTGRALDAIPAHQIERYLGVDISPEMIAYAAENHHSPTTEFAVANFLDYDIEARDPYDTVVCAACLHWFIPQEQAVIEKITAALRPGGNLFLSCAFNFDFFKAEGDAQAAALAYVRNKYPTIAPATVFDDFRFNPQKLLAMLGTLQMQKVQRIEETVDFDNYEDFRDWHLGSGSVLYHQFDDKFRIAAVQEYYQILYEKYRAGQHTISYSTALMLLNKRTS